MEEQEKVKLQPISTSCGDCIFAVRDGDKQTGCEFDRLDGFYENGAIIVEQEHPTKHHKHFVVLGRFCNACRNHEWGDRHPVQEWEDIVRKEFSVRVSMIIYMDNSTSLSDLSRTLESIRYQNPAPHGIYVVANNPSLEARVFVNLFRSMKLPCKWEFRHMQPDDDGMYPGSGYAVDMTLKTCKSTYYSLCTAGFVYPSNYLATIENAINQDMVRFIALLPMDDAGNGLVVQTSLHNYVHGNKEVSIAQKLLEISSEEKTQHMIKRFEDLPLCQ